MSTASGGTSTRFMRERSICAAPVISSTVSPRTRSAIRKAPICAGVAAPAVIWSSAVRISSSVSVAPPETFWIRARNSCEGWASIVRLSGGVAEGAHVAAARAESGHLQEVGEQRVAVLGGDALGMELHAVHGMRRVLHAHDHAALGRGSLGRDGEAVGQARTLDDEGVIARHLEPLGQALENALALVGDLGKLAVHEHRCADHLAAVGLA